MLNTTTDRTGGARLKQFAKRATLVLTAFALMVGIAGSNAGCFKQRVDVGTGASGGQVQEMRQWFVLWGLVPITQIDVEAAIGDAQNYTIESVFTPLDCVINIFTSIVTIYAKTIAVEK